MTPWFSWLFDTLDERLRLRGAGRKTLNKVFPHHWSFLLGEIALVAFGVLVLTGIFLTMFFGILWGAWVLAVKMTEPKSRSAPIGATSDQRA